MFCSMVTSVKKFCLFIVTFFLIFLSYFVFNLQLVKMDVQDLYKNLRIITNNKLAEITKLPDNDRITFHEQYSKLAKLVNEIESTMKSRLDCYVTDNDRQYMRDINDLLENKKRIENILNLNVRREEGYTIVELLEGNTSHQVKFTLDPNSGKYLDFDASEILSKKEENILRKAHKEDWPQLLYEIRKIIKNK